MALRWLLDVGLVVVSLANIYCAESQACAADDSDVYSLVQLRSMSLHTANVSLSPLARTWKSPRAHFPLDYRTHSSCTAFRAHDLSQYLEHSRIDPAHTVSNYARITSLADFASSDKLGVASSGSGGVPLIASISLSASSELQSTENEISKSFFVQRRTRSVAASVRLPSPAFQLNKLQGLLDEDFKNKLNNLSSVDEAAELIKACGAFYVSSAELGAFSTWTTRLDKTSQETLDSVESDMTASLEGSFEDVAGGVDGGVNQKGNHSVVLKKTELTCTRSADGSANVPVVVSYELEALHHLLDPKGKAFGFMKKAFGNPESFQLKVASDPDKCLAVDDQNSRAPGGRVGIRTCEDSDTMHWSLTSDMKIQWEAQHQLCLSQDDYYEAGNVVKLAFCDDGWRWSVDHISSGQLTRIRPMNFDKNCLRSYVVNYNMDLVYGVGIGRCTRGSEPGGTFVSDWLLF